MLRRSLVFSLCVATAGGSVSAQAVRTHRSMSSVGQPVVSLPAITFTPGPMRLNGVTFTPGPMRLNGVTFTPGPMHLNGVTFTPDLSSTHHMTPMSGAQDRAVAHVEASRMTRTPDVARHSVDNTPPRSLPTREPTHRSFPIEAVGCTLSGDVARVDLSGHDTLRPVQVALAARGQDVVALVTMARPGGPREGMVFPTSRLISLMGNGTVPRVSTAPGFEPDASIALGPGGRVFVVGYTRFDARGDLVRSQRSVRVVLLDVHGHRVGTDRVLEDSSGLEIDSPVVPFGQPFQGFAVVLGRKAPDGTPSSIQESLYTFGQNGQGLYPPIVVTNAQSDHTLGKYRVGLGTVPGRDALTVAWTVTSGTDTGVYYRFWSPDMLGPVIRQTARPAWGAQIAHDGSGLLYRIGGEHDAPVQAFYLPWESRQALPVAAGWDLSLAMVRGHALIASTSCIDPEGRAVPALLSVTRPGQGSILALSELSANPTAVVDLDLAVTDDGAVIAWIESTIPGDDTAPRQLALARVVCR